MKPTCKFGKSLSSISKISVLWRTLKNLRLINVLNRIGNLHKYTNMVMLGHYISFKVSDKAVSFFQFKVFYTLLSTCHHS